MWHSRLLRNNLFIKPTDTLITPQVPLGANYFGWQTNNGAPCDWQTKNLPTAVTPHPRWLQLVPHAFNNSTQHQHKKNKHTATCNGCAVSNRMLAPPPPTTRKERLDKPNITLESDRIRLNPSCGDSTPKPSQAKPKPSQAKPSQSKPSQAKPNQAKPSQAKPSQAKPSQAKPRQAKPSQAKPSQAKPSQAKPSQAKPNQAKQNQAKQNPNQAKQNPNQARLS